MVLTPFFPCPSLSSHCPSFVAAWTGCPEDDHLDLVPCCVGWGRLFPASAVRGL
jgi:hypothetical protein